MSDGDGVYQWLGTLLPEVISDNISETKGAVAQLGEVSMESVGRVEGDDEVAFARGELDYFRSPVAP